MVDGKIFICLPDFSGGGAEKVMMTLIKAFAVEHEITCVVLNENGPLIEKLPSVCHVKNLNCFSAKQALIPMIRLFRVEKPEIIFSTLGYFNFVLMFALWLSGHRPRRVVLREANSPASTIDSLPAKWIGKVGYQFLYNQANHVVCNAHYVSTQLVDFGVKSERIAVIPNPVDVREVHRLANKKMIFPKFNNPSLPLFVSIGRLSTQKGMDRLIDWFSLMEIGANLIIIGDGPERLDLEKKISNHGFNDRVKIMNFQKNPFPYMKRADAVLLGSLWEGLPNVALEALALGKTVIASRECKSLQQMKDMKGVPDLIIPATDKAFVEELDNIARIWSERGTPRLAKLCSSLPSGFDVQKVSSKYGSILFGD